MTTSDPVTAFRSALYGLGSVFSRLVYFASLRDEEGRYHHSGLSSGLGEDEASRVIGAAHQAAFAEWLNLAPEGQQNDLNVYLSAFEGTRKKAVLHHWTRVEPHRSVIPEPVEEAERARYLADFEAVLARFAAQYGEPE